jgi:K(+)-stimulated pyrophosphate-energized sodium pump
MSYSLISVALGFLGLLSAYFVYLKVKSSSEGDGRVKEIGDEIHLGAMVFMSAEYKRLAIFCLVCIAALYFSLGWQTASSFLLGALCSGTAGFIGMYSATKANVRTAVAARDQGASEALNIAFFGGSVMGLTVAAMGLIGVGILFYFFAGNIDTIHAIEGFAMGASSVALFSRVGGGIFTKSADVVRIL